MVLNTWPMKLSGVQFARPILPPGRHYAEELLRGGVFVPTNSISARPKGRRSNLLHGGRGRPKSALRDGTSARCMNLKDTRNYTQRTCERERGGSAEWALL